MFLICPFILFGQINPNQIAQTGASTNDVLKWNGSKYTPGANSTALSALTAAGATNSITNANYTQSWTWNTLGANTGLVLVSDAITSGTLFQLTGNMTSSTSAASLLHISNTGTAGSNSVVMIDANSTSATPILNILSTGKIGIDNNSPISKVDITGVAGDGNTGLLALNLLNTTGFKYGLKIKGNTATTANRFALFSTESDSLRIQEGAGDYTIQTFGADLFIASADILDFTGDSIHVTESTIPTVNNAPYILMETGANIFKKATGSSNGDFLSWNQTIGTWGVGYALRARGLRINDWYDIVGTGTVTCSSTISNNRYDNGDQTTLQINLPASPTDGQVCMVSFFDVVTTLTISGNGNTIYGTALVTAGLGTTATYVFSTGMGWFRQ